MTTNIRPLTRGVVIFSYFCHLTGAKLKKSCHLTRGWSLDTTSFQKVTLPKVAILPGVRAKSCHLTRGVVVGHVLVIGHRGGTPVTDYIVADIHHGKKSQLSASPSNA